MRSHWSFSFWILSIVVFRTLPSIPATAADNAIPFYQQQSGTDGDPNLHSLDEYIHNGVETVSPLAGYGKSLKNRSNAMDRLCVIILRRIRSFHSGVKNPFSATC